MKTIDIDYDESRTDKLLLNGKAVTNPVKKFLLEAVIVVTAAFIPVGIVLGLSASVMTFPLHWMLRAMGRKGFGTYGVLSKELHIEISRNSFRKVEPPVTDLPLSLRRTGARFDSE